QSEGGSFRFKPERPDVGARRVADEFNEEEGILPFRTEGRSRIVRHSSRPIVIVYNRRNDVGCLAFPTRLIELLIHPDLVRVVLGIRILSVLPVGAPACIMSFNNMNQTFTLPWVVAVVVGRDDVTILVEDELMCIAQSGCKHFKVAAVRI